MKRLHPLGIALLAAIPSLAQTPPTGTPSTCTTPPTSITALTLERTLFVANTSGTPGTPGTPGTGNALAGVFTTLTPNVPANVLAPILSGAVEVREQFNLDTGTKVLNVQAFTVAPGATSPTRPGSIQANSVLWGYRVNVDKTYFSCQPVPSVLITGTISGNFPDTPFGNANGALIAVGMGYTTDNPPKVNNVTVLIPGIAGLYSPAAVGTLTFPTSGVNPPGTSNAPVIVFTPGQTQTVVQRQAGLDASKSTDPNGLQLSYEWSIAPGSPAAAINGAATATPLITFTTRGTYVFQVKVTNSQGVSSTAQTTIIYAGP